MKNPPIDTTQGSASVGASAIELRACSTCKFSVLQRIAPTDLTRVRVCRRMPPQLVPMQNEQGIGLAALFPVVSDDCWCHEYSPEGAANG